MMKTSTELALFNNQQFMAATGYSDMSNTCMTINNQQTKEATESIHVKPADLSLAKKIQVVSEFSNYLINPLKRCYTTFHNSVTTFFFGIYQWLVTTKSDNLKNAAKDC